MSRQLIKSLLFLSCHSVAVFFFYFLPVTVQALSTPSHNRTFKYEDPTIFNIIHWFTGLIISSTKHLMVQVQRVQSLHNMCSVLGYPTACWQIKQPSQVGSLEFLGSVHSSFVLPWTRVFVRMFSWQSSAIAHTLLHSIRR